MNSYLIGKSRVKWPCYGQTSLKVCLSVKNKDILKHSSNIDSGSKSQPGSSTHQYMKLLHTNSQGTKVCLWNKCFHTLYSRLIRSTYISKCSSPIPEIIVYKQILCITSFTKIQTENEMHYMTNLATLRIQTHTESRILLLEAIKSFWKLKVKRVFEFRTSKTSI